jgi:hypothetical protein
MRKPGKPLGIRVKIPRPKGIRLPKIKGYTPGIKGFKP